MSIKKARAAAGGRQWRDSITECLDYSYDPNPPSSLLDCAVGICKDSYASLSVDFSAVCFYSHNLELEGAPLALMSLIEQSWIDGQSYHVLSESQGALYQELISLAGCVGIEILPKNLGRSSTPFDISIKIKQIAIYLSSLPVSRLFINTTRGYMLASAARLIGMPYEWWIHEAEEPFCFLGRTERYDVAVNEMRSCRNLYFASNATMERYVGILGLASTNCRVLYPVATRRRLVEARCFSDKKGARQILRLESKIVIANVGTYCHRKRQADIIEAYSKLSRAEQMVASVIFAGDIHAEPEYYRSLVRMAMSVNTLAGRDSVLLHPRTGNIQYYYLCADIYVHGSWNECFSQAVKEALFFGLPVVYRETEGMSEMMGLEEKGYSYKTVEDLTFKLSNIIALLQGQ